MYINWIVAFFELLLINADECDECLMSVMITLGTILSALSKLGKCISQILLFASQNQMKSNMVEVKMQLMMCATCFGWLGTNSQPLFIQFLTVPK
jgi:hypothetical protein